jgi:serine/threonine protein kinase
MDHKSLGHYEIVDKIGEGGMGEVYRARDTRLGREVAVKILPEILAQSGDRIGRFRREARLLASLNHPGIATLHGFEEAGGVHFLVMELAEGEDLSQRLSRGPIPVGDALRIIRDVSDALQTAHTQGIVHRDLKPANIKVMPDGKIKVLDFGLAKALESDANDTSLSQSPTIATVAGTMGGVILGTAAYMSPEQARGKPVDKLTDVWALGCVLYEMLTGQQVYPGETVSDTIAKILEREPDWSPLPGDTPRPVQRLLHRCLQKDKAMRLQDVGEIRAEIDGVTSGASQVWAGQPTPADCETPPRPRDRTRLWKFVTAAAAVAAAVFAAAWLTTPSDPPALIRTAINHPQDSRFVSMGDYAGPVTISPDGKSLAFITIEGSLRRKLYVRDLEATEARFLAGTEDACFPFWAPDGRSIGYFTDTHLMRVELAGGLPITICEAINGRGGTWNQDDVILFSPDYQAGLFRVSASGGAPVAVTRVDTTYHSTHRWPEFMPDGKHFVFVAAHHDVSRNKNYGLYFGSLDGVEPRRLLPIGATAVYSGGYLLYLRENTLMAAAFDPEAGEFSGDPYAMVDKVQYDPTTWRAAFSASQNGLLAYHGGGRDETAPRIVVIDEDDAETSVVDQSEARYHLAVSPDGKRVAYSSVYTASGTNNLSIWIHELDSGLRNRLTFNDGADVSPVWSPDGTRVAYGTIRPAGGAGNKQIRIARADGSGGETVFESTDEVWPTGWSSDGRYIVFAKGRFLGTRGDIWILPTAGDRTPVPYLETENDEFGGTLSPDGRWMAYSSRESGQTQLFVSPFTPPGTEDSRQFGKWLISTRAQTLGAKLVWSRDGKQIYYINVTGEIWSINVDGSGDSFVSGSARIVCKSDPWNFGPIGYDVFPDGKRFIVNAFGDAISRPITLVQNWTLQLRD